MSGVVLGYISLIYLLEGVGWVRLRIMDDDGGGTTAACRRWRMKRKAASGVSTAIILKVCCIAIKT